MEENMDMKALQTQEAVWRMNELELSPDIIRDFQKDGTVHVSRGRELTLPRPDELSVIRKYEARTGSLVYAATEDQVVQYGELWRLLTLLYVSRETSEWGWDRKDVQAGIPFAYVHNYTVPDFSEAGGVTVVSEDGVLLRVG